MNDFDLCKRNHQSMLETKKEGTLRLLTLKEIALARRVFGGSIAYHRVWINCASYLPFGLQSENAALAPNGEIWFRKRMYREDFGAICSDITHRHLFIHEMTHVWQHQHHQWVMLRGAFSWMANYSYDLTEGKRLTNYSLEQQAQIVADFYILFYHGCNEFAFYRNHYNFIGYQGTLESGRLLQMYQKTLAGFF